MHPNTKLLFLLLTLAAIWTPPLFAEPPDPRADKELADWVEVQAKRVQLYVVNNGKAPLECEGWVFGKTKTGDNLAKKHVFKVAPDGVAKGFAVYLPYHAPNYFTGGSYYVTCVGEGK